LVLCSLNLHFSSFCAHIYWSHQNFHTYIIHFVGNTHTYFLPNFWIVCSSWA
jgi:hypothetical protein